MNIRIPKQLSALSHLTYGKRVHPSRDWLVILLVALLLLIACVLWSSWMFMHGTEASGANTQTADTPSVSADLLTKTNTLFEERAQEERRYREEYRFVDPSL